MNPFTGDQRPDVNRREDLLINVQGQGFNYLFSILSEVLGEDLVQGDKYVLTLERAFFSKRNHLL